MAEIGWFLHRLAGRVTPPSLGLERAGEEDWQESLYLWETVVLGCCCCHDCYTFGFGFGAFGHVLSKCTSEFLSPIS